MFASCNERKQLCTWTCVSCMIFLSALKSARSNPIVKENLKQEGVAASRFWDVNGEGDPEIQGFASKSSYLPGEKMVLKVDTISLDWRVDIYRIGYYKSFGARKIDTITPIKMSSYKQERCHYERDTHLYDCGNWIANVEWNIPLEGTLLKYIL